MDLFVRNLYNRMTVTLDDITETRGILQAGRKNPLIMRDAISRVPELERMVLLQEKVHTISNACPACKLCIHSV